jgi:nicotinamide-nucleotide amidase
VRAEIVAVGTELLLGQIANTNARWMGERLAAIGVDVLHHQVVGDNVERIVAALRQAAGRSDVVLVTGGLGPTGDDLTRDAIAQAMGVAMIRHPELEEMLREKFAGFSSSPMPPSNLRQADVPDGARYLLPERGTAPGLVASIDGTTVYAMAGVPGEMEEIMERVVLPELAASTAGEAIVSRVLRVTGMGESAVAEVLEDLFEGSANPTVAYLASMGEVRVRLTAKAPSAPEAGSLIAPVADEVRERLGHVVFTAADESLEEVVIGALRARVLRLACGESLTGGGVGQRLTSVPGASGVFAGSAVVYTAWAKRDVLGVSPEIIEQDGVVSEACALAMAAGARRVYGTDLGLGLTGAAGPDPHGGAPPGTIVVALVGDDVRHARAFVARGERARVRRWAEQAGLDLVRRHLEGAPLPASSTTI